METLRWSNRWRYRRNGLLRRTPRWYATNCSAIFNHAWGIWLFIETEKNVDLRLNQGKPTVFGNTWIWRCRHSFKNVPSGGTRRPLRQQAKCRSLALIFTFFIFLDEVWPQMRDSEPCFKLVKQVTTKYLHRHVRYWLFLWICHIIYASVAFSSPIRSFCEPVIFHFNMFHPCCSQPNNDTWNLTRKGINWFSDKTMK